MKFSQAFLFITNLLFLAPGFALAEDVPGSQDFPDLPRVEGTSIIAYEQVDYDLGTFVGAADGQSVVIEEPEGSRTRIVYLGREGQTPLLMQKNYEAALKNLGEVEARFTCRARSCPNQLPKAMWNRSNWVTTKKLPYPQYLYNGSNFRNPSYWYGIVTNGNKQFHVSIFAAMINESSPNPIARNRTLVNVQIVEGTQFEATLEFVDASKMQAEIAEKGHVALYGIQFDYDSHALQAQSNSTIAEIAKALAADRSLSLFVVGHSDAEGAYDYNRNLSLRRASSVVSELTQRFGIAPERLTPVGVGPVSPIASNDSEEGRSLNRRVELVKS